MVHPYPWWVVHTDFAVASNDCFNLHTIQGHTEMCPSSVQFRLNSNTLPVQHVYCKVCLVTPFWWLKSWMKNQPTYMYTGACIMYSIPGDCAWLHLPVACCWVLVNISSNMYHILPANPPCTIPHYICIQIPAYCWLYLLYGTHRYFMHLTKNVKKVWEEVCTTNAQAIWWCMLYIECSK